MKNEFNGYSASWTQPYLPTSYNPFYNQGVDVTNELARMDYLEEQIQEMTHFPDAEDIINKVRNGR